MNNRRFRWGIREKLTLLFFAVTLIAVSVNFLIVVPRLETRLRNDRVEAIAETAQRLDPFVQNLYRSQDPQLASPPYVWESNLRGAAASSGQRIAVLRHKSEFHPVVPVDRFITRWDSSWNLSEDTSVVSTTPSEDPVAARAVQTRSRVAGFSNTRNGLEAEVAVPLIAYDGTAIGAIVFTESLSGVTSTVRQIARRQLVSAVIALSIALLAGLMASSYMARRLRTLENAAREVAKGNFTEPLVVDSEDEIGEVTRAFNMMQERLGRADRARKAFIANASHELRTPLFSLGGYVELMREEELDEETQTEFLDQMHVQITRMTKLATDLLDLSKIDTGSLTIQPQQVGLASLARSIKREFEPQALRHESDITIEIPDDVEALCDPDRLAQIIRILVDNALSHTPAGTNIAINATANASGVAMTVSDNGPGIAPEDIGRIFDRFHTGDKTGGTGLGLSIAKEMASAMNGSLTVQSEPGATQFTLRLPPVKSD